VAVTELQNRFFQRVAPSGVLKSGTDPVDGIFCGGNPEDFVWPKVLPGDNGQVNSMTLDDMAKQGDYTYLAAQVHFEDWTNAFAGNERECRSSPSSPSFSIVAQDMAGGMTRDGRAERIHRQILLGW
jgi:hypothetical protein